MKHNEETFVNFFMEEFEEKQEIFLENILKELLKNIKITVSVKDMKLILSDFDNKDFPKIEEILSLFT